MLKLRRKSGPARSIEGKQIMKSILRSIAVVCLAAVVGLGLASVATAADAPLEISGAKTVDAAAVIDLVQSSDALVIIDNRKEADYNAGHIQGAVRLVDTDMTAPEVLAKVVPAKDTPVLFYCNGLKCGRAANATRHAVEWGYTNVHYYAKGMEEWRAEGLPVDIR